MPGAPQLDPECEIVQALAYIRGRRSGDVALLEGCAGAIRPVVVHGTHTRESVVSWIPVAGPTATFSLCQRHRKEATIREAQPHPEGPLLR